MFTSCIRFSAVLSVLSCLCVSHPLRAQNIESPVEVIEGIEPVTLSYGDYTVHTEIMPLGDIDRYEFFGEAGDRIRIRVANLDTMELRVILRDPGGLEIGQYTCGSHGCELNTELVLPDERGMYSLQVSEYNPDETGRYILQIEKIPPTLLRPDLHRIYYGSGRVQDVLDPYSDTDYFIFEGVAGSVIQIHLRVLDTWEPKIDIWNPDKSRLGYWNCSSHGCDLLISDITLPQSGTYTIAIYEYDGDETGRYDLNLQCLSGDCPPITPAVYQIVDYGPNCAMLRLINNVPVRGGEVGIAFDSSLVSLAAVKPGPGLPAGAKINNGQPVETLPLDGCPADPEVDRGFILNWLNPETGDILLQPGRYDIIEICFDPLAGVENGACTPLKFLDCLGAPESPVRNLVTDQLGSSIPAETLDSRTCIAVSTPFRRGDANGDGRYDVSDPITILICKFLGIGCSSCPEASDVNDDGEVEVTDAIHLLNWRFNGGAAPQPPFPGCGMDPTPGEGQLCIQESCP